MIKYPISTILYLAKLSIKDKIQDTLKLYNNIDVYITIAVKDKNGNVIKKHKQHSHSFVKNFLQVIANIFGETPGVNLAMATLNWSQGLQVGIGTGTPSPNDTALFNLIGNGTGSGQMQYPSNPTISSLTVSGNTSSFTITSTIANNSGASITVSEVGLFASPSGDVLYGLLTHDLLSSPITVPNLSEIQITYTISVTT